MGSFRLAINTLHFHRKFNFTEVILETVEESLLHSCTSAINRQGISLPLDRQKYSRRLLTIIRPACLPIYLFISTGQESDPIHHHFDFAESCVFDKQSFLSAYCLFPLYIRK